MKNINNPNNIILALDCSLRWTNVSVFADDLCVSRRLDIGRRQAAELPLIVEHVLEETNRALSDIGLIAVTNGPGYFTGIRVGASYAAALAYGLNVKVAPVSTLYMLAYPFILQSQPVLVLVYAGKRRVYAASFGRPSPLDAELPEGEYEGGRLEEWFCENPARKKLLLVSDDPPKAVEALCLPGLPQVLQALPDAAIVARIARRAQKPADSSIINSPVINSPINSSIIDSSIINSPINSSIIDSPIIDSSIIDSPSVNSSGAHLSIVSPMELKIFYHRNPQAG